jgi:hypothetical protein
MKTAKPNEHRKRVVSHRMNDVPTRPATVSLSAMQDTPDQSKVKRLRPWLFRAFTVVLAVGVFFVAPIALHEVIHVLLAVVTGVSPFDLDVGFVGVYPGVEVNDSMDGWQLALFRYSGGLVAGAAMVYVYVRWYWGWSDNKTSLGEWWIGVLILVIAGNELAEGAFHAEYIANQNPAITISLVATVAGFLVHRFMLGSRGTRLAIMRVEYGNRS